VNSHFKAAWVALMLFAISTSLCAQARKKKPAPKPPFVCSSFFWTWYENGLTNLSFSIKNQSGTDLKNVEFRVLFFDRFGKQVHFQESNTRDVIPTGMTERASITLDLDTGLSVRKISTTQKVEILNFEKAP
jgi:hypothetical protein